MEQQDQEINTDNEHNVSTRRGVWYSSSFTVFLLQNGSYSAPDLFSNDFASNLKPFVQTAGEMDGRGMQDKEQVQILYHECQVRTASVVKWSEFSATDPEVPGSILGATTFSEK
jgi:hypothetical protein